jgi:hypothetical protein
VEWAKLYQFSEDREGNKALAAEAALTLLLNYLQGKQI